MIAARPLITPRPHGNNLLESLKFGEGLVSRTIHVRKHGNVYNIGGEDKLLYFIESGQVKLGLPSPDGKECLLAIYTAKDLFGESCLAGTGAYLETATAMTDTMLKGIYYRNLLKFLQDKSLYEELVTYLATRLAEQQQVIADMVTADSEYRLGKVLLQLCRKLGKRGPFSIRIENRISHEELSQLVGTTRPRISVFIQKFRSLGLLEISAERFLVVREKELTDYLARHT